MIPDLNIADIHLPEFSASADAELKKAIRDAHQGRERHHPRSARQRRRQSAQAVSVSSQFMPAGADKNVMILKNWRPARPSRSQGWRPGNEDPLAVLVDANTAVPPRSPPGDRGRPS